MKLKNCVVGQRVQIKEHQPIGSGIFWPEGATGVIVKIRDKPYYNIVVQFDNGTTDSGNHTNLRKIKE